jgi:multidrug efflux system membrane fusion protein
MWLVGILVSRTARIAWMAHPATRRRARRCRAKEGRRRRSRSSRSPRATTTCRSIFSALGTVTAFNTVTVKSRVDGQIVNIAFKEGQTVAAGDLLVEIDPRPFQVQLANAQGQMARDQAQLEVAKRTLQRNRSCSTRASSRARCSTISRRRSASTKARCRSTRR